MPCRMPEGRQAAAAADSSSSSILLGLDQIQNPRAVVALYWTRFLTPVPSCAVLLTRRTAGDSSRPLRFSLCCSALLCIMSEMKDSNAPAALDGNPQPMDQTEDNSMPSAQQQEEAIKKKFGGLMPKKPPLISKDHERAYFDSADWALGKQGVAKPKGPLEALRPKLQPTRQQQQQRARRSIYTSSENEDGDGAGTEDMSIN
ncbi:unnamed protein product [Miscanthus lutarioriparius]|uniref:cAMP-regulated phosphoprotein 19-related protein n=1 Tax=Miscanthus lutarioriparius TaxID=422564 RepID=A0A811P563_9POAL|nr:unnamed protein product [Miscanthus lutarioriparius]